MLSPRLALAETGTMQIFHRSQDSRTACDPTAADPTAAPDPAASAASAATRVATAPDHAPPPPDLLAHLRLIRSHRVGPATYRRLISEHGSAAEALRALPDIARAAGVTDYQPCPEPVARAEIAAARRLKARALVLGHAGYPAALSDLPDAPPVLWLRGRAELLHRPMIAIVGARAASSLGGRMARQLAEELAEAGFCVVSGLARGIDTAAHSAAPSATAAVLAGGLGRIYPDENRNLADKLARDGAVLSEMPPGTQPLARHFPARNRIIAGLSLGVIVVEAAARSGSLITAARAAEYGREVMAVPGHPLDPRAAGPNLLLRDGATLVRNSTDVLETLAPALAARAAPAAAAGDGRAPAAAAPGTPHRTTRIAGAASRHDAGHRPAGGPRHAGPAPESLAAPVARRSSAGPGRPAGATPAQARGDESDTPDMAGLKRAIMDRLSPVPVSEDTLVCDLGMPAGLVMAALTELQIAGKLARMPGGKVASC